MNFLIIFTIFACVQSLKTNVDLPTQVIYKVGSTDKNINVGTDGDFLAFIQLSTLWVDKSLLIANIWTKRGNINYNIYIISAATRWGKTINLNMIQFYHQLEVDEYGKVVDVKKTAAYKYFVEGNVVTPIFKTEPLNASPLISRLESLTEEHLASHPVITLDGTKLNIEDPTSIRRMISKAYQPHNYLVKKWKMDKYLYADELEDFYKYYKDDGSLVLDSFIEGIVDLSSLLVKTYKRRVIILYDEHDAYLHKAYFKKGSQFEESAQSKLFLNTLENFMQTTFKKNSYIEKGIITGVLAVHQATFLSRLNNVYNGYVFTDEYIFPFYGIFQQEFKSAMELANLKDIMENATRWYDGYRILTHPDVPMYSTFSISNCLTRKNVKNYWTDSAVANFIPKLFDHPEFREDMMQLMKEEPSDFTILRSNLDAFDIEDLALIQRLCLGLEQYDKKKHRGVVFSMMISIGFATFHSSGDKYIKICLPNREIQMYISTKWLDSMKIEEDAYTNCEEIIRELVSGDDTNILDKLAECVSAVLSTECGGTLRGSLADHKNYRTKEPFDKMITTDCVMNEATMESIFYVMIRRALYFDFTRLDQLKSAQQGDKKLLFMNRRMIDMIFIIKNKMVLIFENKFHSLVSTHPKPKLITTHHQAISYSAFFIPYDVSDIPIFKFIALQGEHTGKVEIRCATLSSDQLEKGMSISESKLIKETTMTTIATTLSEDDKTTSPTDASITTLPSTKGMQTTSNPIPKRRIRLSKVILSTEEERKNYQIWNDSMWDYIEGITPSVISVGLYDPTKQSGKNHLKTNVALISTNQNND